MAVNPSDASQTPNLNDYIQRIILLIRLIFGSTIVAIILGAIGLILLVALSLLHGR